MYFDDSDYNIPPCCSQKYFKRLFEHLKTHSSTTLFVLPDYDLAHALERLLVHMPTSDMTIALARPDYNMVHAFTYALDRPWTGTDGQGVFPSHQLVNLRLIIAPPEKKTDPQNQVSLPDTSLRRSLLETFGPYGDRVHLYEDDIATTVIYIKRGDSEIALYGDILQTAATSHKELRLLHATTDPKILKEIRQVLKMHQHHEVTKQ